MRTEVRKLWIEGPAGKLEAALRLTSPARGAAVVAHPHPLHGGTLHNPVVFHSDRELSRAGLTTLRFNFRGVGSSEGVHDEGRGEIEDLAAAVRWLRGSAPGVPLLAVGYSFGSRCAIRHAGRDPLVSAVIALGLPVRLSSFPEIKTLARPIAVIQGSDDELGSPDEIQELLDQANPKGRLYTIEGTAHLFENQTKQAGARVVEATETILEELDSGPA